MKKILLLIHFVIFTLTVVGQSKPIFSLEDVIRIASKETVESFRITNEFKKQEWVYNLYKADRLPSFSLNVTPAYERSLFNSTSSYLTPTNYNYLAGVTEISLQQKVTPLGGYFFVSTQLSYQQFYGGTTPYSLRGMNHVFGADLIRVGYQHDLLGYNEFKWEKLLSTVQFKKAVKSFFFNMQVISEQATIQFFDVAKTYATYEMSQANLKAANALYEIGKERFAITSIKQEELLSLELQSINAKNTLTNAALDLDKAKSSMMSFLNIDNIPDFEIILPSIPNHQLLIKVDDAIAKAKENNPHYLELEQSILQAEQKVDKTTKESKLRASLNVSVGVQQLGATIANSYNDQQQYSTAHISISIPLFDFGAAKSRRQIAHLDLTAAKYSSQEVERIMREEIVNAISDFNVQQHLVLQTQLAISLADKSFKQTAKSYAMGQSDINTFTLAQNRKDEAYNNYISSLQNYWLSHSKLCRITLFDYINNVSLADNIDDVLEY